VIASTFGSTHDFFNSGAWFVIRNLLIFFALVFWAATIWWIYKDAKRRIEDPWLVGVSCLLGVVVPFFGPFIYMLFRPPEYLEDVRERELEIRAMEDRLSMRGSQCPVCRADVDPSFLVCPVCTTRLKHACINCNAPLEARWQVCPYCETPVESPGVELPIVEARPRRRRRSSST